MEILGIILVGILLLLGFFLTKPGGSKWQDPKSTKASEDALLAYEVRQSLFVNRSELALFSALGRHKIDGFHIMAKVRLEDVLGVRGDIKDHRLRWQYRGRIKSRHVDFIICNDAGQFLCGLELDGSAHFGGEAEMVDGFKDAIFKNAGIKLLRIKTGVDFDAFSRQLWQQVRIN